VGASLQSDFSSDQKQRILCQALITLQELLKFSNRDMAQILHIKPNTYGNWLQQKRVPLSSHGLAPESEIIITVLAIYRSLGAMFQNSADQTIWLTSPHPDLKNISPLNFMKASCQNLFYLRTYLDFVRGRGA
jgi:hypothetical protein